MKIILEYDEMAGVLKVTINAPINLTEQEVLTRLLAELAKRFARVEVGGC